MIIGHQRIIQYLSRSTALKNLSHAHLFQRSGIDWENDDCYGVCQVFQCPNAKNGRQLFNYCGRCKNCYDMDIKSHPDFTIFPSAAFEENEIKIGQIRDLIRIFSFKITRRLIKSLLLIMRIK